MDRMYSILTVKAVEDDERVIRGTATTPRPDRMGDVVEPLGVTFKNPMPLLHQHDSTRPVGTVKFDKPTKDGITFEARLPKIEEPGALKDRVDTAWQEVKAGLVRAVSIGFRALEYSFMDEGGIRFLASEVLELSLVSVPANGDCTISQIKSIDAPLLAATGKEPKASDRPAPPGVTGTKTLKPVNLKAKEAKTMSKTIAEQITALEAKRAANAARMAEIMQKSTDEGRTTDAAEQEEFDNLEAETAPLDADLKRFRSLEKASAAAARPVIAATAEQGAQHRAPQQTVQVKSAAPKGTGFVRLLSARFMAKEDGCSPYDIAVSRGWGDDVASVLKVPKHMIKAAVAAASTTDSTWAGPLVTYNNLQNEFLELLRPRTLIGRIPGLRAVPFNVKVPRETGETTGYWVGQGSPKPVSKGALDTVTLDFNKVAGITFLTQELLRFSQPSAEALMINSLTRAIIKLVDNDFLDPSKAVVTGVSPASVTNGVSAITASGSTADAFRADFGRLMAVYTAANYALDDMVLVMSQTQAFKLALLRNDFGGREFPDINKDGGSIEGVPVITTENIAANGGSPADGRIIVAMAANSILIADDGGVEVDISTEASIQTDDAPDSPVTASTTLVSLWQNNLVGIRVERFVTWVKGRTGAVQYISGANYG